MNQKTRGYLYALISTIIVASGYVSNYVLLQRLTPAGAAFAVYGLSALVAAATWLAWRKKHEVAIIRKHGKQLLVFGVLNSVGTLLWFQTLSIIGPALAGFLFRFVTIFAIAMGILFLKERFNAGEAVGMLLIVAGAGVITYTDFSLAGGAVLAIVASFCFAAVGLVAKKWLGGVSALSLNSVRIVLMFIIIAAYAASQGAAALPPVELAPYVIGSAFVIVVGLLIYYESIRLTELSKVATVGALEPMFVLLFSLALLAKVPTNVQLLGGLVIMAGLAVLLRYRKKPVLHAE